MRDKLIDKAREYCKNNQIESGMLLTVKNKKTGIVLVSQAIADFAMEQNKELQEQNEKLKGLLKECLMNPLTNLKTREKIKQAINGDN